MKNNTQVQVNKDRISAARLEQLYTIKGANNKILDAHISPSGFSDHHLVFMEYLLPSAFKPLSYWHFNMLSVGFCEKLYNFGGNLEGKKLILIIWCNSGKWAKYI